MKNTQHIMAARKLQELITEFLHQANDPLGHRARSPPPHCANWSLPSRLTQRFSSSPGLSSGGQSGASLHKHKTISRELFTKVMNQPEIEGLLSDLDVTARDPLVLFDVLDA